MVRYEARHWAKSVVFICTAPITGEDADGSACERYYMTDAKLARSGYKPHVGDEVNVSFNRFGKPDIITVIK